MQITVLGATGGIGRAIVHELHARGHAVVAVSRSITPADVPAGVTAHAADVTDPVAARSACAGAEVVVMAANLPYNRWASELHPMVDGALAAAIAVGARFVMVDNLYAYGSPGVPITDTTPEAATTRKGALRREVGRRLRAAHADGAPGVTIGRFADYYGPGPFDSSLVNMLGIRRALAGKAPQAFVAADQPHTFVYLADAARGFATLVERPEADGRSWILPAAPAVTQRELLAIVAAEAGIAPRLGRVTPAMLAVAGLVSPQLREAREVVAQFARPYVTRADDFEAAFGPSETTPHERAVAETIAHFRSAGRGLAQVSGR